jgi:hypothetical protein
MAPNLDKEADHIRNKARKELLGLLESVSTVECTTMATQHAKPEIVGPGQEELGHRERLDSPAQPVHSVSYPQGIRCRQGFRTRERQHGLIAEEHHLPRTWRAGSTSSACSRCVQILTFPFLSAH